MTFDTAGQKPCRTLAGQNPAEPWQDRSKPFQGAAQAAAADPAGSVMQFQPNGCPPLQQCQVPLQVQLTALNDKGKGKDIASNLTIVHFMECDVCCFKAEFQTLAQTSLTEQLFPGK